VVLNYTVMIHLLPVNHFLINLDCFEALKMSLFLKKTQIIEKKFLKVIHV